MRTATEWAVWSTTARIVVTDPAHLPAARALTESVLADVDRAASRFRPDSELSTVYAHGGRPVSVSPLLAELVRVALRAAARTEGDVDPTVGAWLDELGYDRDISRLEDGNDRPVSLHLAPDWRRISLHHTTLTVPAGVRLDLGATAKAYAADLAAETIAARLGQGVVVALGGDIATAGASPEGGWPVRVQDGPDQPGTTVRLPDGGALATSSTLRRRWVRGGHVLHHIIDPRAGWPARPVWRTVSVAAGDCVSANTATTAAVVRGPAAPAYLAGTGLPARLVAADGRVSTIGAWPRNEDLPAHEEVAA